MIKKHNKKVTSQAADNTSIHEISNETKENTDSNVQEQLSDNDVTAHTAAMWKYNPIPETPEPYSEYKTSYENYQNVEVIGARVRGKKHKHEGTNCDDWYEFDCVDDWTIAVVSDGAGSKSFSRIGAKSCCEAVIKNLKTELRAVKDICPEITEALGMAFDNSEFTSACSKLAVLAQSSFGTAFSALEDAYLSRSNKAEFKESLGRDTEIKDYSCTLLMAVIIPVMVLGKNEHFIISIQIGDGMIASVNAGADFENALRLLGNADSGGFAGETEFITSDQTRTADSLRSRTKIQRGTITTLMLMSDGVADDYYPNSPQLLRLYLDLMLNEVIDAQGDKKISESKYTIPEPISYPWVNDGDVKYSLQYAKNLLAENNLTLAQLWKIRNDSIISNAQIKNFGAAKCGDKSEALSIWIDNYVERGSFDDRTLIIINVK